MPAVLRFQVFSLMGLLLCGLLTLLPFFVGVFAFILLTFRHDLVLLEHGDSRSNPIIQIVLVEEGPMRIACPFADLDPFKELVLVGFECGKMLCCQDICGTMKTG